jgi:hypothetical protein
MPIPFKLLSAALQESEKQGYIFVTQTMITIAPGSRLAIPTPAQQMPAFLVVFKSENTTPPDLSILGLTAQV